MIAFIYAISTTRPAATATDSEDDEESRPLLHDRLNNPQRTERGSNDDDDGDDEDDDDEDEDEDEQEIKRLQEERVKEEGWFGYLRGFSMFIPHILPFKDPMAQVWMLAMVCCIAVDRYFVLAVPRQFGLVIDALTNSAGTGKPQQFLAKMKFTCFPSLIVKKVPCHGRHCLSGFFWKL